ncbi:hypothetical protein C5F51_22750 [Nocardia nova]|uniref:Uncharacterized protein n=1 Tax=Nocardia nova TaxID=37330 RepID=A0A2S6A249_9NOCA|nr:hypothetical protein C5F51_22750 [Nocardia nova]
MTLRGRGSTRAGRPATLPEGVYEPPRPEQTRALVVAFHGEDGRSRDFGFAELPLPQWHSVLAQALSERIGPQGARRTHASARSSWASLVRFVRFLAALPEPPATPAALTIEHLDRFRAHREQTVGDLCWMDFREICLLAKSPALESLLDAPVRDYMRRRTEWWQNKRVAPPGYSDGELNRIVRAARADVAQIRDRIRAGRGLVARYRLDPREISPEERPLAQQLSEIAATGVVPRLAGFPQQPARLNLAEKLFLSQRDLCPVMTLLVAVTGRNVETLKELPVQHRVLEERAVELRVVKRRRGPRHWHETVSWEIGEPGRELHTPGGLYLLVHELTGPGRALLTDPGRIWAIWRNAVNGNPLAVIAEHCDPYAVGLHAVNVLPNHWAARHELAADTTGDAPAAPLRLDFRRLKRSIEVRHTRQMGGHLPSSVRTNSIPVLFSSYLRGDPTVVEWAHDTVSAAVADAEESALAAHRRALTRAGGHLRIITTATPTIEPERADTDNASAATTSTAWSECLDHNHHPATGKPCRATFLDCFHCGNCMISAQHLPRLLALLDALSIRRQQMSEHDWWRRYGSAWAAIRHDILAKFTPAEIENASTIKPDDALLDLVEQPWQQP